MHSDVDNWPAGVDRRSGDSDVEAFARTLIDHADEEDGDQANGIISWFCWFTDSEKARADALARACGLVAAPEAFIASLDENGTVRVRTYDNSGDACDAWFSGVAAEL